MVEGGDGDGEVVGGAVIDGGLLLLTEGETVVLDEGELASDVGRWPGSQNTLSPSAVGRRATSVSGMASVKAAPAVVVHVHASGFLRVEGFPR